MGKLSYLKNQRKAKCKICMEDIEKDTNCFVMEEIYMQTSYRKLFFCKKCEKEILQFLKQVQKIDYINDTIEAGNLVSS